MSPIKTAQGYILYRFEELHDGAQQTARLARRIWYAAGEPSTIADNAGKLKPLWEAVDRALANGNHRYDASGRIWVDPDGPGESEDEGAAIDRTREGLRRLVSGQ